MSAAAGVTFVSVGPHSSGLSLCLSYSHGGSVTVSVIVSLCLSQYQRLCQSLCRSILSLCWYVCMVCLSPSVSARSVYSYPPPPPRPPSLSLSLSDFESTPIDCGQTKFIHLPWSNKLYSLIRSLLISPVVADQPGEVLIRLSMEITGYFRMTQ